MDLIFDTETSGLPKYRSSYKEDQPWVVQVGAILSGPFKPVGELNMIVELNGRSISKGAQNTHHISELDCERYGVNEAVVCLAFLELAVTANILVCHNAGFDKLLMCHMLFNNGFDVEADYIWNKDTFCTMEHSTELLKLPKARGKGYKWPKLEELYRFLFNEDFDGAHDAMADTRATARCYYKLTEDIPF